jgi:hypothetical protein
MYDMAWMDGLTQGSSGLMVIGHMAFDGLIRFAAALSGQALSYESLYYCK